MSSRRAPLAALVLVVFTFQWSYSFNLEPRIPIIKKGPETSHFGYTVAQHKSQHGSADYLSWMLVGAPKGTNLQPGTEKSGALYKCPMTTNTTDCQQVLTDGLRNSNGIYKGNPDGKILPPTEDEIKDDQWMGVTVKSQGEGGDILVCGHRYQYKGIGEQNFRWGYGLCYRLTDNFEYEDNYQPCKGKPVDLEHEQFGYCQAGTSGMILEDEVLLGIPGTYTWRGTVHTRNISDDYLYRDKTQYFGVYTDDTSPVDKYSYLGYSVTAGKFFGDKLSYVAGAPRSRGTGQVIFFSREKMGNPIMHFDLILNGEMFASSFGFEVLAMDVNADKKDDLIVSAPFYFTKQSSGAVYVYLNNGKGISNETPFTRLEGAPGESRFGYSMTSLGDLNLDGFNDLAIGAPYENRGAIYIYLGSKDGIMREPSQVIRAEDLPGIPYDAFGYALSGGMDLDNNNYNDLLTSSFCSDRVILLRARPIIDITTKVESQALQNINPTKPGCEEDRTSPEPCFSFNACFKMMNEGGTSTFLALRYNISERVYKDQPIPRIRFHRSDPGNPSTLVKTLYLRPENMGTFQCSREVVYLKSGLPDVLRPVRFVLSYKIDQRDPKPVAEGAALPDINDYPILNQQEAVRYFEATFAKECGSDDICESNLSVVGSVHLEKHPKEDYYIFELGKRLLFNLTINVSNDGDPAYFPKLFVSHDKGIDLSLRESETGSYQCVPDGGSGLLKCDLDNPLVNSTGPIKLVFKPSGLPFKTRYIDLDVWVNSTSKELNEADNKIKYILEVKRRAEISITGSTEPEQVFYSGDVVGESAINTVEEIGTEVLHKYVVDNGGPWRVDDLQVQIHWPYQVENNKKDGKWLLYLTDIPVVDGDGECDVNPEYVNPLLLGRSHLRPEDEAEIGDHDRLTGATPSSVESTTKITKTSSSKKVITTSTKKVISKKITEKKSSSASSSSSSATSESEDVIEGSDSYGRGGTRTHARVSRKAYVPESKKSEKTDDKDGIYDNTEEYEDYDSFFYGNDKRKSSIDVDRHSGSGRPEPDTGRSVHESTYTKRVDTTKVDGGRTDFVTESDRLNSVDDIKTIKEGDETYINGYDKNGNLIWSSRKSIWDNEPSSTFESGASGDNTVHTRTEHTQRIYTSGDRSTLGGNIESDGTDFGHDSNVERTSSRRVISSNTRERNNARLLNEKIDSVVDFSIIRDGDQSWVNGYDRYGNIVWTTRFKDSQVHRSRTSHDRDDIDRFGHRGTDVSSSSTRTEYEYKKATGDQNGDVKTKHSWTTSISDKDGTRTRSGSSFSGGEKEIDGINYSGKHVIEHDRRTDEENRLLFKEGGRGGKSTSVHTNYSFRETATDEDGDGDLERRRSWSSSVTDEDGTRSRNGSGLVGKDVTGESHLDGNLYGTRRSYKSSVGSASSSTPDEIDFGGRSYASGSSSYRSKTSSLDGGEYGRTYHTSDENSRSGSSSLSSSARGGSSSNGVERHHARTYISEGEDNSPQNYGNGKDAKATRYRFDWNSDNNRQSVPHSRSEHHHHNDRVLSESNTGEKWSRSGGFKRNYDRPSNSERDYVYNDENIDGFPTAEAKNSKYSSHQTRLSESSISDQPAEDKSRLHGSTYSRAVFDRNSGHVNVYSQKVFSRKSGDQWQEVHGPYKEEEWSREYNYGDDDERSQTLSRKKREREVIIKPEAITDSQTGKTMQIVSFRCDGDAPTAKCFTFQCTIRNLAASQTATIRIPARLWNSTLVEDYPRVSYVSIKSKGELLLPEEIRLDQDQADDVSYAETLAYSNLLEQLPPEEVPLWVILVSVLAGLLLLVLIAIILWKLGFFKRKRPDPTLSGNIDRDVNGYN